MKKQVLASAVLAACAFGAMAQSLGETPWMVRARAVYLDSVNGDNTGLGLTVNNKTIPEVDISYFFNKNIAAELILTVPQRHTVYSKGSSIGTFKHLPPTLTVQYHFTDLPGVKPYMGAGINYTRISQVNLLGGAADLENDSIGGALQVGVDIPLDKKFSVNFDLKKVYIRSDVFSGGSNAGTFRIDPVLLGVGVGYRF